MQSNRVDSVCISCCCRILHTVLEARLGRPSRPPFADGIAFPKPPVLTRHHAQDMLTCPLSAESLLAIVLSFAQASEGKMNS